MPSRWPVLLRPRAPPRRQGSDRVPDDTRLLVDIGDGQHRAIGKGQGAPVGRLAAALGVEHRAIQRDAPAAGPAVRLCG